MARTAKPAPVISIIVPVRNEARTIAQNLFALKPFRQRGVEIIVADGGSTDETALLARPLADRVVGAPGTRAAQMNAGARVATGFIFVFVRPETRLPEDADTQVMYGRARDTSVWGCFDLRIVGQHMLLPLVARMMNWRSHMAGIATSEQAIFVQRETFFRIGGFADIPLMEDIEISKRLKAISPPICVPSRVTISGRRFDQDGLWKTAREILALRFRYWIGADPTELARRYGYELPPAQPVRTVGSVQARKRS